MTRNCVLVIEDEADLRETIEMLLELKGYSVVTASNGREGLEQLMDRCKQPCLVLLDLMMPVMDGWEFLAAVRSKQSSVPAELPIAVVSAAADLSEVARNYHCEVARKPVSVPDLLRLVSKYCSRSCAH